jgi:predicted hydrocarbon binding protein
MHGVILKTLQDFVIGEYGQDAWETVQRRADVEEKVYVPVTVYPDRDVYEIAQAAGDVAGESPRRILRDYGRFVVPPLVSMYDIHIDDEWDGLELIANIEQFHTSLRTRDMVDMTTPRVRSEWLTEGESVRITYDSDRQLCDVAFGAIQGVGDMFDERLVFEEETCMLEGDDACTFTITRSQADAEASASSDIDAERPA